MDDEKIISMLFARDEAALAALRDKYGAALQRLASNILPTAEDAEECVSDTLFSLWNAIPPARPVRLFAYAAKTTRNRALSKLEYDAAAKRAIPVTELTKELEECIPAPEEGCDLIPAIEQFLRGESELSRGLFIRRYFYCDSLKQAAEFFSVSESRAKSALFRTRARLRSYLEKEELL